MENTTSTTQTQTIVVPPGKIAAAIRPARKSTISWVGGVGGLIALANTAAPYFGYAVITPEQATAVNTTIAVGVGLFVWVKRTWFHEA